MMVNQKFDALPTVPLQKGATFLTPRQQLSERVELGDPALVVMTDFALVTAHKINPLETIEAARVKMIHYGVRMLFVVDDQSHILGLITATDLTGEKPMQVIQAQGIQHTDVLVKDIMTPREKLEVLCLDDVQKSVVGQVVATLQKQGRQHALVAERRSDRSQVLRGMFSASQIGRQLAMPLHTHPVAETFAEIGAHLSD
jgi:CBS-domain-containing membrane protein